MATAAESLAKHRDGRRLMSIEIYTATGLPPIAQTLKTPRFEPRFSTNRFLRAA